MQSLYRRFLGWFGLVGSNLWWEGILWPAFAFSRSFVCLIKSEISNLAVHWNHIRNLKKHGLFKFHPSILFSCCVVSDSFAIPGTIARQAPPSMGFPRQGYWSALPFPSLPPLYANSEFQGKGVVSAGFLCFIYLFFVFGCADASLPRSGFLCFWWAGLGEAAVCRGAQASRCSGFSCCRAWAIGCAGFSHCGLWAWLPRVLWNLPRPGIEPTSSALAGGS